MTTIVLTSTKQSPGTTVTTLALACQWSLSEPALVAELDPDGGDLTSLCGLVAEANGLLSLTTAGRHADTIPNAMAHCQYFGQRQLPIVTAPHTSRQVEYVLQAMGDRLTSSLALTEHTVFADVGRMRSSSPVLATVESADLILVVMRPNIHEAQSVAGEISRLREIGPEVALLLIGERPYSASEVQQTLDVPVAGVIADDKRGVQSLLASPDSRSTTSSMLLRTAKDVTDHLRQHLTAKVSA